MWDVPVPTQWGREETSPLVLGEGPASPPITEELRDERAPKQEYSGTYEKVFPFPASPKLDLQ